MAGEANIRVSKARETSTSSKLDQEQKIRPKELTLTSKVWYVVNVALLSCQISAVHSRNYPSSVENWVFKLGSNLESESKVYLEVF